MDDFTFSLIHEFPRNSIPSQEDDQDSVVFQYLQSPTIYPCLELDPTIHHHQEDHLQETNDHDQKIDIKNNDIMITDKAAKRLQKLSSSSSAHGCGKNHDFSKQKKVHHRYIERQRRQEMAKLYSSLRNLLPLQSQKRRRSVSDHLVHAVNHIKHMERNIRELGLKRDKLKKLTAGCSNLDVKKAVEETNSSTIKFTVQQCSGGGIEILMKNYNLAENMRFPLSRLLDMLLDEGLSVNSYICTKVNEEFLYTIQAEANADVDLKCLQEKLSEKVKTWKDLKS